MFSEEMEKRSQSIRHRLRYLACVGTLMVLSMAALATVDYRTGRFVFAGLAAACGIANFWLVCRNLNTWVEFNKSLSSLEKMHNEDT